MVPPVAFAASEREAGKADEQSFEAAEPLVDQQAEEETAGNEAEPVRTETPAEESETHEESNDEPAKEPATDSQAVPAGEAPADSKNKEDTEEDVEPPAGQDQLMNESRQTDAAEDAPVMKKALLKVSDGESISYTASRDSDSNEIVFKATINGQEYTGTCNECGVAYKSSGTMKITELGKSDLRRKVAYKYKSWHKSSDRNYDMGGVYKGVCLEAMMQYARAWMDDKDEGGDDNRTAVRDHWRSSDGNGWAASTCDAIIDAVKDLNGKTVDELEIPGKFRAYHGTVTNTTSDGRKYGQDALLWGNLVTGKIKIKKVPEAGFEDYVANHPDEFDLTGAEYQLYEDEACTKKAKDADWENALLTTNASGTSNTLTMEVGTYYIKEIKKPAKGYEIETDSVTGGAVVHKETIKEDKTTSPTYSEKVPPPPESPVFIRKADASGSALSGAKLQIFDGNAAVGDAWTSNGTDHKVNGLTAGKTYTLRELSAPGGFEIAEDQTFTAPAPGGEAITVTMKNIPVTVETTAKSASTGTQTGARKQNEKITDTIKMTGLVPGRTYRIVGKLMNKRTGAEVAGVTASPVSFAADAATMTRTMDLTFDSTKLADNDEVVVFETLYRTSQANNSEVVPSAGKEIAKHEDLSDTGQTVKYTPVPVKIRKVNTATGAVLSGAKLQILQGSVVKAEWTTDSTEWHEVKGLEPGEYVLREVSAPYGFDIAGDVSFSFDGLSSKSITMGNTPVTLSTSAVSKATGRRIGPRKNNEVITDTVHVAGLVKGREYRLSGKLMNKRTGAAVPNVTASPKTFTATAAAMDVTMDFTFDSTALADGDSVVVYETLYRMTKVHNETVPAELGKHENINDAAQTVTYPGISTAAIDQSSQTHNLLAGPNATVADTVTYKGLLPGVSYTLEGELFDKTANRLTGIKATAIIPADAQPNGTAKMTFTFDASGMDDHTLVVYETLKLDTVTITEHRDPADADQTIYIPEVKTTLTDDKTKDHLSNASETVTLTDKVVCSNLIVGRSYTISGKLVYRDSGNDVLDNGHLVEAEPVTFTAQASAETKELKFTFNGSVLEGRTVVAFEDLTTNFKRVGTHADLTDEPQNDHIPRIRTTALDSETNDHISLGDESITIHDTVSYENLIPGKTYTVTGKLMDKTSGKEIPNVTSEPVEFKAASANETVVVDFVFNGRNWQDHRTVAFEKLYLGTKAQMTDRTLIAAHEDLSDTDQTVHIPEIGTTLLDAKTNDHIALGEKTVTLKDTVAYRNLIKGREYTVSGKLMNKRTGQPVKVNGADVVSKPVTFTATAENGTVEVTFVFDGTSLTGETMVAFETITYRGVPVAVHANIGDKNQTVPIPKIRTAAAISDDNRVFTDTINYENLLEGRKYVFRGWLVDTVTGTKIPGSDGMAELTATEANMNGSVQMTMDTAGYDNMYGHSMTAFEELYVIEKVDGADKEIKVAEHKDRTGDESSNPQTIGIYHDLKVKKNVTGNLGDLTKIFEYTVAFTDLVPDTTYTVEGDDAKTFKAEADGKATLELKLADDQSVTIRKLPKSATYTVTEAASDHVAEYRMFSEDMAGKGARIRVKEASNSAEAAELLSTAKETVDLFDGTVVVLWENNRDLATLTGVRTHLGIWAAAFALVLAGIAAIVIRRRRYDAAE